MKMNGNYVIYDSLHELQESANLAPENVENVPCWNGALNMTMMENEWFGMPEDCSNPKEKLREQLRDGWPEGRDRAHALLKTLSIPFIPSIRRRRVRREQGGDVDMQRVYTGQLDTAWSRTERAPTSTPIHVHVISQMGVHSEQSADELLWRGACTYIITKSLMKAGYHVRVSSAFGHTFSYNNPPLGTERDGGTAITVKPFRSRPDEGMLFAACSHPGVLRSLEFSDCFRRSKFALESGLSLPQDFPAEIMERPNVKVVEVPRVISSFPEASSFLGAVAEEFR